MSALPLLLRLRLSSSCPIQDSLYSRLQPGRLCEKQVPEKDIKLLQGGCPVHAAVSVKDLEKAKARHPEALVLVHPECQPNICDRADYIGSTSGIIAYAKQSDATSFIIGTEISIAETLQYACPDKQFYPLTKNWFARI